MSAAAARIPPAPRVYPPVAPGGAAVTDYVPHPGVLTPRQRAIYRFLLSELLAHQRMPTVREMQAAFGIASPNGLFCHLQALVKKGFLVRGDKGKWHALRLAGVTLKPVFDDTEAGRAARQLWESADD